MDHRGRLSFIVIAALAWVTAAGTPPLAATSAPVRIVAAENFYGDLAMQIGGTHVNVTSILSNPDDDPHLFETSASTAKALAGADIAIYNGIDYDPWMPKLLSASKKDKRATIIAADLVGARTGDNPHLWYDPRTLPAVAKALEQKLEQLDPANADAYKSNLAAFDKSFAPIIAHVDAIKQKHGGVTVTATEPVFGYMAKALGFGMLNDDFQVAVMNNAEPTPSQLAAFETSLRSGKVKILFYNKQVTDKTTERLRKIAIDAKVQIVGVTETEPKEQTIQTWFAGQLDEIADALNSNSM